MQKMWLTGYRSYEMGVFSDTDPKLAVIKYALTEKVQQALDDGLEWLITGGQLGIEQWGVEVAYTLKNNYPQLQIAVMLPFVDFGSQWQENNRGKLKQIIELSDFSEYITKKPYQSPKQLKLYQQFMLDHTDGALLVYDEEFQGKALFDYQAIKHQQTRQNYPLIQLDMDQLQAYGNLYQENQVVDFE